MEEGAEDSFLFPCLSDAACDYCDNPLLRCQKPSRSADGIGDCREFFVPLLCLFLPVCLGAPTTVHVSDGY